MKTHEMLVELKRVKLTKSKIQQMEYIGIPKFPNAADVIGWVNLDKKRWVIIKLNGHFYRAEFITEIGKEVKGVQFPAEGGGWEFPHLHAIKVQTYNCRSHPIAFSPERDDEKNLELYKHLVEFKRKTEIAGQVYY